FFPSRDQRSVLSYFSSIYLPGPRIIKPDYCSCSSYFCLRLAMTDGSARVVVSPNALPSATSRRSRRMILPLLVFGRSAVNRISLGRARLPIFLDTYVFNSSDLSLPVAL